MTERKLAQWIERGRLKSVAPVVVGFLVMLLPVVGCGSKEKPVDETDDILVSINDSSLRIREVIMRIPIGTAPEDSARLFHAIVNSWVDDRLLESVALENIDDMDRIEALVSDYRRKLIAEAYKRKMRRTAPIKISEDSLKRYYNSRLDELKTETPLVKGVYIKIPKDSPHYADIRRWVFSGKADDIDAIESVGMEEAVQYDYFVDKWIEFSSIAEQIPYRFYDPDAFLRSTSNFETTYNGFVYLLHVSEFVPTGETMPYEYARLIISDRLGDEQFTAFERRLMSEIRSEAVKDGRLKTPGYDLRQRRVMLPSVSNSGPEPKK